MAKPKPIPSGKNELKRAVAKGKKDTPLEKELRDRPPADPKKP